MAKEGTEPEKEKLTTARVQRLKEAGYYWDSELPGFCVRVNPGGSKVYLARYRNERGQQKWVRVGKHPANTADEARIQAKSILGDSAKGLDPATERDKKREAILVKDFAEAFKAKHVAAKKPATARSYKRQLDLYILPALGKRAMAAVTDGHIASILSKLEDRPVLRNRVLALLSKMFNLAERWPDGKDWVCRPHGSNPCLGLEKLKEEPRERFLTDAELEALGRVLDAEQALAEKKLEAIQKGNKKLARAIDAEDLQAILAIKFLLFSGRRKNEALTLRWTEVDMEARAMRLETKTGHLLVDINDQMLEVLQTALRFRKLGNPFVFPGSPRKPKPGEKKAEPKPWVNLMKPWNRVLEAAGVWKRGSKDAIKPTIHDIRRTFGTVGAGEVELPHETIGKVLGHKQTSTTAIYARLAGNKRREASGKIGSAMAKKLKKQA